MLPSGGDDRLTSLDWFADGGGGWNGDGPDPAPEPRPPPLLAEVPDPVLNFCRRLFMMDVPDSFEVAVEEIDGDLLSSSDGRGVLPAR